MVFRNAPAWLINQPPSPPSWLTAWRAGPICCLASFVCKRSTSPSARQLIDDRIVKSVSAICINSCISSHFFRSATSAAMPRSPKYLLLFSQSAIISWCGGCKQPYHNRSSPYTTIKIRWFFGFGSKPLKTFIFSFLLQVLSLSPHLLDE